jgi:hypothetical protein
MPPDAAAELSALVFLQRQLFLRQNDRQALSIGTGHKILPKVNSKEYYMTSI